jgi:hypothetical protein
MPIAPVVVWLILVKSVLMQRVGLEDAELTIITGRTVIVPVALPRLVPPVSGTL